MDLKEAMLKAKLVSKEQLDTQEKIKKQKSNKSEPQKDPVPVLESFKLTDEKYKKFEDLWGNEKSKKFCIHLLHSFIPFNDNYFVLTWEDKDQWKNGKKCCFCGEETLSKDDTFKHIKEMADISLQAMLKSVKEEEFNSSEYITQEKKKIFGDKIFGVTSEKTSCVICNSCYDNFSEWIETKLMYDGGFGDFSKIITYIRRSHLKKSVAI